MGPRKDLSTLLAGLLVLLAAALGAGPAAAQQERPWSVETGLGFTADPESFLLEFEGNYRVGGGFSFGPMVQLGLDDDFTLVSSTGYFRYTFDLSGVGSGGLRRLEPYVQTGFGFTYVNRDVPPGFDDDDADFLADFGFGADFRLNESFSLDSRMLFNFIPGGVFGENFYYSWQVAGLRFRF